MPCEYAVNSNRQLTAYPAYSTGHPCAVSSEKPRLDGNAASLNATAHHRERRHLSRTWVSGWVTEDDAGEAVLKVWFERTAKPVGDILRATMR